MPPPPSSSGWLQEKGNAQEFEMLPEDVINDHLTQFYSEVRSAEGEPLSASTLRGIRAGIGRHLQNPPFKRDIIITSSSTFTSSNKMLKSIIAKNKKDGNDTTKHYPCISDPDLQKLVAEDAFDENDPTQLQQKVFLDVQFAFGRRGREGLSSLTKNSFEFKKDAEGHEYADISYNEWSKNSREGGEVRAKPRIYAMEESPRCPIRTLKSYLSHLNPKKDKKDKENFYQYAIKRKDYEPKNHQIWYTPKAIGDKILGSFMKTISQRLNLSYLYTNHSIRVTVVSLLSRSGFEARQIMRVTGHKCEASLRHYDHDNSDVQKRAISNILHKKTYPSATPTATQAVVCTTVNTQQDNVLPNFNISGNYNCSFEIVVKPK